MCDCSLASAITFWAEQSSPAQAGCACRCLQTSAPQSNGAIAIATAELPGKAVTPLFKKNNLSGADAAMIQENTVFILQRQLSKSMGSRGHGYAACLSGASGAVSPAQPLPQVTTAVIREIPSSKTGSSPQRGEKPECVSNEDRTCVKTPPGQTAFLNIKNIPGRDGKRKQVREQGGKPGFCYSQCSGNAPFLVIPHHLVPNTKKLVRVHAGLRPGEWSAGYVLPEE